MNHRYSSLVWQCQRSLVCLCSNSHIPHRKSANPLIQSGVSKKAFGFPTPLGPIDITAPSTILCEKVRIRLNIAHVHKIADSLLPAVVRDSDYANIVPWAYQDRCTLLLQAYFLSTQAECSEFVNLDIDLPDRHMDRCLRCRVHLGLWLPSCSGVGR